MTLLNTLFGLCTVLALFAANAADAAIRCHECIPDRINNFCLDYKEGVPTAARQTTCEGFCFKADGSFKIDYGVEKDRTKNFVVSACIDQRAADALEIGNKDKCQSSDKAKRLLEPIISQTGGNTNQQQQQSQYGQQQQRNQYQQQQQQQQLSFHLPGRLDDARYCRCDTELCNGATTKSMMTIVSASTIVALGLVTAIKNSFY